MKDSTKSLGGTQGMPPDHSRHQTVDVDALTPDSPSISVTILTLFMSLFSVSTGIALFTLGDAPTGAPVPVISLIFIAAGILVWAGASIERQTESPELPS
jgi:hypothetical protein